MKSIFTYRPTSIAIVIVVLVGMIACHKGPRLHTDAVTDRAAMPVLDGTNVTTLISDSGITRYRIKTARWMVFDKANPPYWEFPEGIYLERFDEQLNVNAWLQSDYAIYDEQAQIWRLNGNVHAMNLEGEQFETPELYWNQHTEKVYSDSVITITREASIIKGVGFESNQEMSKYTIRKPTGIFPIKDDEE